MTVFKDNRTKNVKRNRHLLVLFFLMTAFLLSCTKNQNDDISLNNVEVDADYNSFPGMAFIQVCKGDGRAYGDNELARSESGILEQVVVFADNHPSEQQYILLALVDENQCEFEADGYSCESYRFTLPDENPKPIKIEIHSFPEDAGSVTYLILANPDETDLSLEDDAHERRTYATQFCAAQQIFLRKDFAPNYLEKQSASFYDTHSMGGVHLTKAPVQGIAYLLPQAVAGEEVYLTCNNTSDFAMDYILIAFCDWKQVAFDEDNPVLYFRLNENEGVQYQYRLPEVTEASPYQVILITRGMDNDEPYSFIQATYRTIIRRE